MGWQSDCVLARVPCIGAPCPDLIRLFFLFSLAKNVLRRDGIVVMALVVRSSLLTALECVLECLLMDTLSLTLRCSTLARCCF